MSLVRHFVAKATRSNAGKYYAFFQNTLAPKLKEIRGHQGALVLSNDRGGEVTITVLTFWESDEAIRAFAGDDPGKAVIEPEARAILSSFDLHVTRMAVEVDTRSGGSGPAAG